MLRKFLKLPMGGKDTLDFLNGRVLVMSEEVADDQPINEVGNLGLLATHRLNYLQDAEGHILIFQIFTKQCLAKLVHCMAWNYQAAKQKTFGSTGDCGQWNFLKAV